MRTLANLDGPGLTPDQFWQSAFDQPFGKLDTFGSATASGFLSTFGAGTVAREAYAPDVAKQVVGGGRGGVQWRYNTPQEVQARGDTLYQTADEYKASPNYRDNIPWEKGMTASRAAALADMNDTQQLRDYVGSKRPVLAFLGNVTGSALDPVNYIPIVGEAGYTATAARVGKIAARTLLSGTDAALNAGIAGLATAPDRAKLGDDTSWQAMGENMAYAALAGFTFGAIHGTVGTLRERNVSHETPNVNHFVPDTVTAPPERAFWQTSDHINPSPVETPVMRAKAVMVMNDAMISLAHDGEVRLSPEAVAHFETLAKSSDSTLPSLSMADTVSQPQAPLPFQGYVDAQSRIAAEAKPAVTLDEHTQRMVDSAKAEGLFVAPEPPAKPSANASDPLQQDGAWRSAMVKGTMDDGTTYEMKAGPVVDNLNKRISLVKSLMECMGAAAA